MLFFFSLSFESNALIKIKVDECVGGEVVHQLDDKFFLFGRIPFQQKKLVKYLIGKRGGIFPAPCLLTTPLIASYFMAQLI